MRGGHRPGPGRRAYTCPMETGTKVLHWKDRSHRFTPHFHTEFYVGAIVRGYCEFEAGGRQHVAGPGDLVLINPFEVHTAGCSPDVEYRAVYFDDLPTLKALAAAGSSAGAHGDAPQFLSFTRTVIPRSPLAERLAGVLGADGDTPALSSCLEEVMDLYTTQKDADLDMHDFQARVVAALDAAHDGHDDASIARLAATLGMSPQHFSRAFHRVFGVPAVFFRNQLRMHRAEAHLRRGGKASEVALECGFSDQAHLIRELKKVRGVTPKLYATAYRHLG